MTTGLHCAAPIAASPTGLERPDGRLPLQGWASSPRGLPLGQPRETYSPFPEQPSSQGYLLWRDKSHKATIHGCHPGTWLLDKTGSLGTLPPGSRQECRPAALGSGAQRRLRQEPGTLVAQCRVTPWVVLSPFLSPHVPPTCAHRLIYKGEEKGSEIPDAAHAWRTIRAGLGWGLHHHLQPSMADAWAFGYSAPAVTNRPTMSTSGPRSHPTDGHTGPLHQVLMLTPATVLSW